MGGRGSQIGQFLDRKRVEQAADESQALRVATSDVALDAIIVCDEEWRVLEWNPAAERTFGHRRDDVLGKPVGEHVLPPGSREDHLAKLRNYVQSGEERARGRLLEMTAMRADGTEFPAEIAVDVSRVRGKSVFVAFVRDITERRAAQDALERKTRELLRSNADLQQFAYVASHDLQEPLRMVAGFTQLLAKRYHGKLDAKADQWIEFAADGAIRMQRLIDDLLEYSRLETGTGPYGPVESEESLRECLGNLQSALRETGAEVTHDPLPRVQAHGPHLVRVFQNLIANAVKFRSEDRPARVHVSAERNGSDWTFSVRDNGIGIEGRDRERVFQIFQRLHAPGRYPGTGIGLAICKKVVERHGGRIWVESTPGDGSAFRFTMPSA